MIELSGASEACNPILCSTAQVLLICLSAQAGMVCTSKWIELKSMLGVDACFLAVSLCIAGSC